MFIMYLIFNIVFIQDSSYNEELIPPSLLLILVDNIATFKCHPCSKSQLKLIIKEQFLFRTEYQHRQGNMLIIKLTNLVPSNVPIHFGKRKLPIPTYRWISMSLLSIMFIIFDWIDAR